MLKLDELLNTLNPQQRAAVEHRGSPMLIKALAGSGKTTVITARAAHLMLHDGIPAERILTVTFTKKAADEMKSRILNLTGAEPAEKKKGKKANPLPIGTFHSIGCRMVRAHAEKIFLKNTFTILDEDESLYLFKKLFKDHQVDRKAHADDPLLSSPANFQFAHSRAVNRGQPAVLGIREFITPANEATADAICRAYDAHKYDHNLLDFDDILRYWKELLETEATGQEIREQWDHILVDEYQDTNDLQEQILSRLNTANLCVVGDLHQSIYSFRLANPENFRNFTKRYPDAKQFPLETNYRSTQQVIDTANALLKRAHDDNRLRAHRNEAGHPIRCRIYDDPYCEADAIARDIRAEISNGTPADQIAVLSRTSMTSRQIEQVLTRMGIRYDKYGGFEMSDRREIKDCIAFARVLLNPQDRLAWRRILQLYPGIGDARAEEFLKSWREVCKANDPLDPERADYQDLLATLPKKDPCATGAFGLMQDFRQQRKTLHQAIGDIQAEWLRIAGTNYENDNLEERIENVDRELASWKREENLTQLIENISLTKSEEYNRLAQEREEGKTRIIISTIHSAKGLEWDHVFLCGAGNKQIPHPRSAGKPREEEEEDRLLYVAVTRARQRLTITMPRSMQYKQERVEQTATPALEQFFKE